MEIVSSGKSTGSNDRPLPLWSFDKSPFEKSLHSLFIFSILFSLILFADYFLPRTIKKEVIEEWYVQADDLKMERYQYIEGIEDVAEVFFRIKTPSYFIALNANDAKQLFPGDTLNMYTTKIFRTLTDIEQPDSKLRIKPYLNSYGVLLLIPVLLVVLSCIGLFTVLRDDWIYTIAVLDMLLLGLFAILRLMYL